jgi:hypothetical protein
VTETISVKEPLKILDINPPVCEIITEKVMIREAFTKYEKQ